MRTTAIDRIVGTFTASTQGRRAQIVSLGAGSDTRFFRLRRQRSDLDLIYHELDFPANTRAKIGRLRKPDFVKAAKQLCQVDLDASDVEVTEGGSRLGSPTYCIHPTDLRTLSPGRSPLSDINTTLPTLLISECCLIYLSPDHADAVLESFTTLFPPATPLAIVVYEPIRPFDSFGRTMVRNLTARGIHLQTLEKYADLKEQRQRLEQARFAAEGGGAEAADVDFIWRQWIDEKEKGRVEGLEWMDEVEEFVLLGKHYCIAWGWRGFDDNDAAWKSLRSPAR